MAKRASGKVERIGAQATVDAMLAAGKTYAKIVAEVEKKHGSTLTEMSVSRYRKSWATKARQLEEATCEAEVVIKFLREHPEGDLAGAGIALMLKSLVKRFADIEEIFDGADGVDLGHLLVKAARIGQTADALALMRERLELQKKRAEKAADTVKDSMTKAGASADEISRTVNEILGVTAA